MDFTYAAIQLYYRKYKEPALLQPCTQIRGEASAMYYALISFNVGYNQLLQPFVLRRLSNIASSGTMDLNVAYQSCLYTGRQNLLPLVRLIAKTGLRLRCGGWNGDQFVFDEEHQRAHGRSQNFAALELGLKAFDEGWSPEMVDDEYIQWQDTQGQRRGRSARKPTQPIKSWSVVGTARKHTYLSEGTEVETAACRVESQNLCTW